MSASDEEINALLRRAEANKKQGGMPEVARVFWFGYGAALRELQSGLGKKAAAKDFATQQTASAPVRGNQRDEAA